MPVPVHTHGDWGGGGSGALPPVPPRRPGARKLPAGGCLGRRVRRLAVYRCGFPLRCRRGSGRGLGRCGCVGPRGGRGCRFALSFRQLTAEVVDYVLEGRDLSLERGDHGLLRRGGGEGRLGRAVAPLTPLAARAATRRRPLVVRCGWCDIPWMVILGDRGIKKNKFQKHRFFELPRVKNYISRFCTNPLGDPPLCAQYPNRVKIM